MVAAQAGGLTPIRGSLQKTAVQLIEAAVFVCAPCPFRVNLRRSPGVPPASGAGGEADEIGTKAEVSSF